MLIIPKSATKCKVKTKCYGEVREWSDRKEAQSFFLEAMMNSDGSERDRYCSIYIQLLCGESFCTDEEAITENY